MLVLTRRIGERIYIGRDIYITLLSVDTNKARIGIVAPQDMTVLREELLKGKDNDNAASTDSTESARESTHHSSSKHRRDERS